MSAAAEGGVTWMTDTEFDQDTITGVTPYENGTGYTVSLSSGWHLNVPTGPITPEPGQSIRLYGRGLGYDIRGIVIADHVFRYATPDQWATQRAQAAAERLAQRRTQYAAARPELDTQIAALPAPYRDRLTGFMARAPETAWEHQGYELAVCRAAIAIHAACEDGSDVRLFAECPVSEQISRAPLLAELDLSGNQFGAACRLAQLQHLDVTLIPQEHAALCVLAGCRDCGCHALTLAQASA